MGPIDGRNIAGVSAEMQVSLQKAVASKGSVHNRLHGNMVVFIRDEGRYIAGNGSAKRGRDGC